MISPLRGIRILDLSRLLPGPFCSYLLAKLGAEVTVIAPPPSLEEVLTFPSIQKNKKRVQLNLKDPKDHQRFRPLVKKVDVVLEGFRPGVLKRLKIDFSTLKKINPKIILCSLTGYGQKEGNRAGHDLNYLGASGFLSAFFGIKIPSIPGIPLADLIGGMFAALQIIAALSIPKKKRKAIHLDVSMVDALKTFLVPLKGEIKEKFALISSGNIARYHLYETLDHQWLAVAPLEEKFWNQFVRRIRAPFSILAQEEKEIIEWLKKRFKEKNQKEWLEILNDPDFCVSPVI